MTIFNKNAIIAGVATAAVALSNAERIAGVIGRAYRKVKPAPVTKPCSVPITGTARVNAILRSIELEAQAGGKPRDESYSYTYRRHAIYIDTL